MIIHKPALIACMALCLLVPTLSQACSPPVRTPGSEEAMIEKATAIVKIKVVQSEADRSELAVKEVVAMQAEVLEVYKGDVSEHTQITVLSRNYGTCSIFLPSGITRDVLLMKEGDAYYIMTESSFLSTEAWDSLKHKE